MRQYIRLFVLLVVISISVWVLSETPQAKVESNINSECVKCHTDVKRLIRLGWEVEKLKGKPISSEEIEGEG